MSKKMKKVRKKKEENEDEKGSIRKIKGKWKSKG
jgi:hypothetical protein